ncbi:hypothetical protein [Lysobacter sp. TY2-98]|uniref:hypothetical protein n=1 Tax=Lysobacter sp. TY2-98 TaxID=2290922 RepID=UPI0013B3B90C|nr:hypothetical protein [Lysobacter sp. TY2-98]
MRNDERRGLSAANSKARAGVVLLALAILAGCPLAAFAEASSAYCTVDDSGGRHIWVSSVFTPPPSASADDLATDFHTYVGTLGGAGMKQCVVADRATVDATRARVAEIMGKRVFGIRVYTWHDVPWTPDASRYAAASPVPRGASTQYVYCRMVDVETRTMVTSAVIPVQMPGRQDMAHFSTLERWQKAFGAQAAAAYRVNESPNCIASDTAAEATKDLEDYRKAFRFSRVKNIEMPWVPDAADASAPPAARQTAAAAAPTASSSAKGAKAADDDVEAEFWRRISGSRQAADFDDYLASFPQGRHAPIARLEARRLRGESGGTGASAAASTNAATVPDAIASRIAKDPFFQLPASGGGSVERSGSHKTGSLAVNLTLRAQREPASNLCRVHTTSSAGGVETRYDGTTWAGLLALDGTMRSQSQMGPHEFRSQVTSIDALEGQPFPLVEGHTFGYTASLRTTDGGAINISTATAYRCVVGRTGPASAVVPGRSGDATELQCTLTLKDSPTKPLQQTVHWFSDAGCFVQDPSR